MVFDWRGSSSQLAEVGVGPDGVSATVWRSRGTRWSVRVRVDGVPEAVTATRMLWPSLDEARLAAERIAIAAVDGR